MSKKCYTPVKGIDDEIAKRVNGWTPHMVANLRGLYEEKYGAFMPTGSNGTSIIRSIESPSSMEEIQNFEDRRRKFLSKRVNRYNNNLLSDYYYKGSLSTQDEFAERANELRGTQNALENNPAIENDLIQNPIVEASENMFAEVAKLATDSGNPYHQLFNLYKDKLGRNPKVIIDNDIKAEAVTQTTSEGFLIKINPELYNARFRNLTREDAIDFTLHLFNHELTHAFTSQALAVAPNTLYDKYFNSEIRQKFNKDIHDIILYAKSKGLELSFGENIDNDPANFAREFVAELMSNQNLQTELMNIPYKNEHKSILSKIAEFFSDLFNNFFGQQIHSSVFEKAFDTTIDYITNDLTINVNDLDYFDNGKMDKSIDTLTDTMVEFSKELHQSEAKKQTELVNNPTKSYQKLREEFNAEDRYNRISMISTLFSDIVDAVQEENPNLSRKQIIAGLEIDGNKVGGISAIFNEIYDTLQEQYSEAIEEGDKETANKYKKIFDNWGALISFAKIRIRDIEDVKLGQDISFADDSNPNNFNDNDMTQKFVMEESKKEGWMEQAEFESAFGSIGKQVRKVIGRTPVYKNGEVVLDDLGFPIMQNPVKLHQELLDVLRGISSESEMINTLKEYSNTVEWVTPFLEELENPVTRTQFYVDFKKNFQPYAMQTSKQDGFVKTFKTAILNRIKGDKSFSSFLAAIRMGTVANPTRSIYEVSGESTRVLPIRVERTKNRIIDILEEPKNIAEQSKFWNMKRVDRKQFLMDSIESLGIDLDGDTLDRIMSKNKEVRALTKELLDAAKFGLNLTKEEQEGKKVISYEDLIKRASTNEKKGVLREKITKMLAIISKNREGLQLESRVRYNDNTFFSNVIPSFMGDRFDKIASFAKSGNSKALKAMLDVTYLNSSYFKYGDRILNKWIEELYNSDLSKDDNFAANFAYKRFLGTDKLTFEDFTSKQHAVQMLNEYFSERQISSNSKYAWYPVFILGDSGVSKFIKAKRYSGQEILDGMYNVYIQEKRRIELTKAVNNKLKEDGYKAIDNVSKKVNEYSLLTFLNDPKYSSIINENNLEQTVKKAIRTYMDDAVTDFKTKLNNLGVLENNNGKYVYLDKEVKGDRTIDKVLADFYWNSKFAMIQQLQMMTIDPAFYKGTKDLQKRYKEIHAPGTPLSLEAINPWTNERYSEDGIERVVYFDDIDINAEKSNPEFMQAIANHFGKNSNVYNMYKENTLTDGQGYRTLESYKKVMGMAGKWDESMENAYNQIQDIRTRIGRESNPSMDDIKALIDLAVVFQPIKPYLYSFENYSINSSNMFKIPVQHKYAEAILIPELLPAGSKLRDIAYWMEDHVNKDTKKHEPIDMIGSTKVVKVGGFGSTNIDNVNSENISEVLDNGYVHQLSYEDYRIQTNVPEHVNSSQLFGTQVRKLIMAGIKKAKDYSRYVKGKKVNLGGKYGSVNLNGTNLIRFYNSLITANILESYDLFKDAISDPTKVSERLSQVTANNSRESKDNLIAYGINEDGKFTIPLYEGALEHDSSALLFSLFKKMVNKQSIKGGSAVQVSALGITGYEEDGGLKYVTDPNNPNNILYAECEIPWDLNYVDSNGNEQSLDFETYCNEDGTLKTDKDGNALIEKDYPNILSLLAYRIPTERAYSMINLKVKRFSHKMAGGTIKVPAQGTTIAGFDFDIDKLYFMRNEYKYKELDSKQLEKAWKDFYSEHPDLYRELLDLRKADEGVGNLLSALLNTEVNEKDRLYKYKEGITKEFNEWFKSRKQKYSSLEEYDFSKSPLENTKASRNNMLINLIQQRLMDEETFKERYTPGGFAGASKAARIMRELLFGKVKTNDYKVDLSNIEQSIDDKADPEPNYDPTDPMTMIVYNQQNQVAGKLIGIFANQNTNHAFASLMESFALKVPIEFAGKKYSDLLNNNEVDTSLTVAEFLSASVDAVKDPVLNFLNLNTITADAGAMLARLGFTTEDIGLLFNQPIIKDICDYSFNNNMSDINSVINNVLDNYEVKGEVNKAIPDIEFSRESLAYNIVAGANSSKEALMSDNKFVSRQRHVAELFRQVLEASNDVSQFVRNTKFTASNAVGSTFGDMYAQQMKVAKYVESFNNVKNLHVTMKVAENINTPINNDYTSLGRSNQEYMEKLLDNPFAYEQAMYDMNRKALEVVNNYYPYDTNNYKYARENIASLTKSELLDAETINSIHSDLLVYMLNQEENSLFNDLMPIEGYEDITSREYYSDVFPRTLFNILQSNPSMKELPIFKYMQFQSDDEGKISMNIQDIGGLNPEQKDEIKESWGDLMRNDNTKDIAKDLFLYNYFKLGFTYSPLGFMNLAPSEVKLGIQVGYDYDGNPRTYVDFLNDVMENKININNEDFTQQYLLNHLDNNRLVFRPKGNSASIINNLAFTNGVANDTFILDASKLGKDANPFLLDSSIDGFKAFRPVIIINDAVYMSQGRNINLSSNNTMLYKRVEPLGDSGKSLHYTSDINSSSKSVKVQSLETIDSNSSVEPEIIKEDYNLMTTDQLIKEATKLAIEADNSLQGDLVVEMLRGVTREDLIDTIEALKTKADNLKDQEGNKIC